MVWQFLRDLGLITFVVGTGGVAIGRLLRSRVPLPDVELLHFVGDRVMIVGACVAVSAMVIGYLAPHFPS